MVDKSPSNHLDPVMSKMMNMMYIFNRNGCLYYQEWHRPNSAQTDDDKLMFGLIFSLKSFVRKLDPIK